MIRTSKSGRQIKPTEKMAQLMLENEILRTQLEISQTEDKLRRMSVAASEISVIHAQTDASSVYTDRQQNAQDRSPTQAAQDPRSTSTRQSVPNELMLPTQGILNQHLNQMQAIQDNQFPAMQAIQDNQFPAMQAQQVPSVSSRNVTFAPHMYNDFSMPSPAPMYHSTPRTVPSNMCDYTTVSMLSKLTLPKLEPEVFNGSLIKFPIWMKSFETLIENNTTVPAERLYFLSKYTTGEAKDAIQGYFVLDDERAYNDAKRTLISRYGDRYRASEAFKMQIHNWPDVKPGDGDALQKLADFLQHCNSAMHTLSHLQSLDSADENRKILRKLPRYICDRWNRIIDRWLYSPDDANMDYEGKYPPFSEFCRFLSNEARVARGPGNLNYNTGCSESKPYKGGSTRKTARVFASDTERQEISAEPKDKPTERPIRCTLCSQEHYLPSCEKFKALSLDERRSHASSKGICFSCLRRGHIRKDCRRKGKPLMYMGLPPYDQDKPRERTEQEGSSYKVEVKSSTPECLHSLIVKVAVHHADNPAKEFQTYAMLDNQSNSCFINDCLADSLNLPRVPVNLRLTTMLDKKLVKSDIVHGLIVRGIKESMEIALPGTYTRMSIPATNSLIPKPEIVKQWPHLRDVADQLHKCDEDTEIGLLIGFNCSSALLPKEIVAAGDSDPYAVKTNLGWGVTGVMDLKQGSEHINPSTDAYSHHFTFRTHVKEISPSQVKEMFERDFMEENSDKKLSIEDRRFLKIVKEGIQKRSDGHFEIPLPFKDEVKLPNNKIMAEKRLDGLRKRMTRNDQYRKDYVKFMNEIISNGHAERAPKEEVADKVWYIPHHGVYHPRKPGKIRIVFDCSAEFRGESLNRHLLQGPDLINNLTGVLCRFRKEPIAIACDIEGMFHQVNVSPAHRDFLRFLWFEDSKLEGRPVAYRMTVHLFGAVSSPGCANFALKTTADTYEPTCGKAAADFVRRDFYVDDGLQSVATVEEAKSLVKNAQDLCKQGGFNLHKFVCTEREVLRFIPIESRDKNIQCLDLTHENLPVSRTLGIEWCIEEDVFRFRIKQDADMKITRRGILSAVSSIYDPIGLISPLLLTGRQILQTICRDGCSWDDPIPEDIAVKWKQWHDNLSELSDLQVKRCYKDKDLGKPKTVELHHFSDASLTGYGECSYLRLIDEQGSITTSLVMSKSRVTPSKPVTVPRLELTAAVLAVKVAVFLQGELDYEQITHTFWTDSKVVLGYITNNTRRFHMFVANRVHQIRCFTNPDQWHYIETNLNPADLTSRGMTAREIISSAIWWNGPPFLKTEALHLNREEGVIRSDDPEVRKVIVHAASADIEKTDIINRLTSFSDWHRATRAIAACLRLIERVRMPKVQTAETGLDVKYSSPEVKYLQHAEHLILKAVQEKAFPEELKVLRGKKYASKQEDAKQRNCEMKKSSSLYRLDPFIGEDGIMRVGGRIRRANISYELSHPIILPRYGHITELIISHSHVRSCHSGSNTTLSELRASGYWIIKGRAAVTSFVHKCVTCRKLRGNTGVQKMSDLPVDRMEEAPPFTSSGVDLFGPFLIKEGRSEKKRWGVLFTCLTTRAIHIEVAHRLTTDSFINAYRRFIGRRGSIRLLRCDRGTNFVGAKNELAAALKEMDQYRIKCDLAKDGCDWITFNMNFPHASHMGGCWERMIRSVRNVLAFILSQHGGQLDDELLATFMVEAEAVVNSRPLTYVDTSSGDAPEALTPSHLLTLRSRVVLPPPGNFVKEDMFCRKRWRRVQYLANQFWIRWRREYLPTLQERKKWIKEQPDLKVDDIVLVLDEALPRCKWPYGRVVKTYPSSDAHVRKVTVKTVTSTLDRPISQLVFLYRPENPVEEP